MRLGPTDSAPGGLEWRDSRSWFLVAWHFLVARLIRFPRRRRWLILSLIGGWLLSCAVASAASVSITGCTVGLGGKSKLGCWVPINVTISADRSIRGRVIVTAPDGEGIPCCFAGPARSLSPGEQKITQLIRIGREAPRLQIRFTDVEGSEDLVLPFVLQLGVGDVVRATQQLVLCFGAGAEVEPALRLRPRRPSESFRVARVTNPDELPAEWLGYDGVDVVFLATGDTSFAERLRERQWQSLESWISLGGKLLLSVGSHGDTLLASGQPLARLVPGKFDTLVRLREASELQSFAQSTQRIDLLWRELPRDEWGLIASRLLDIRGHVDAAEGAGSRRTAWSIRSAHGLGTVSFLACDIDVPPLRDWNGRPRLVLRLVNELLGSDLDDQMEPNDFAGSDLGFDDLSGQLRAGLGQFSGVRLIPFSLIALLAAAFVLWIGPLDYFLLRRYVGRMEWTWLTFLLAVSVMCGVAIGLARYWKGEEPKQNTVEILDLDVAGNQARCDVWTDVFLPAAGHHDFAMRASITGIASAGHMLAWQGLPGTGFGGMRNATPAALFSEAYTISSPTSTTAEIVGRPVPTAATCHWRGVWWGGCDLKHSGELSAGRQDSLVGQVRNPLQVPLLEAMLCYGRMYYAVGTLEPGQTFVVDELTRPANLRYRLTRRRQMIDKEMTSPWQRESLDVPRICEIMMFHQKAGGRGYTDLLHRYEGRIDLSQHLDTGAAVLIGKLPQPATEVTMDGKQIDEAWVQRWSYVRLVYPVRNSSNDSNTR